MTSAPLTVTQIVALVGDDDLYEVIHRLEERIEERNKANLSEIVAVACAQDKQLVEAIAGNGAPTLFVWGVNEYNNGWFFAGSSVTVTFANGEVEEVEADFDKILTEIRSDIGGDQVDSNSSLQYDVATKEYKLL